MDGIVLVSIRQKNSGKLINTSMEDVVEGHLYQDSNKDFLDVCIPEKLQYIFTRYNASQNYHMVKLQLRYHDERKGPCLPRSQRFRHKD